MNSRGPNSLSLNQYAQIDNIQISSTTPSPYNYSADNQTIQQNFNMFVKQIRERDQILQTLTNKMQQISSATHLDFDYELNPALNLIYENDEQKKMIVYNQPQVNKVITALQKGNSRLKNDAKGLNFQFVKAAKFTQALLQQNKILRKFASQKNKDIINLLHKITTAQNPQLLQLQNSINQAKQQNQILSDHYKQINKKLGQKHKEKIALSKAMDEAMKVNLKLKHELKKCQDEQEHAAKKSILQKQSQKEWEMKKKSLLAKIDKLKIQEQEYKNDVHQINQQMQKINNQNVLLKKSASQQVIKNKSQTINFTPNNQNPELNYEQIIQQNKLIQQQIARNQQRVSEYEIQNRKLDRKLKQYQKQLSQKQRTQTHTQNKQIQMLCKLDQTDIQIRSLKDQLKLRQQSFNKIQSQGQMQINKIKQSKDEQLNKLYRQLQTSKKQNKKNIDKQEQQINKYHHQLLQKQKKISQINKNIQQMLNNLRQNQQQKQIISRQRRGIQFIQSKSPKNHT